MKNLGTKDEMYPTVVENKEEPEIRYPSVTLPLSLLEDNNVELGDKVTLTLKGKVERIEKSKYSKDFSVELKEGEIVTPQRETKTTEK